MNSRLKQLIIAVVVTGLWALAPQAVYADNCSSLNDCYYTLRAALAAAVGLGVFAALMSIGLDIGPLARTGRKRMKEGTGSGGVDAGTTDEWDRSLGVVPVEGLSAPLRSPGTAVSDSRTGGEAAPEAAGAVPDEAMSGMQPSRKPVEAGEAPSTEPRMAQSQARGEMSGEHGGMEQSRSGAQDPAERTAEQMRSASPEEAAGRSGEWSGERGHSAGNVADSGDVMDRAHDVAEAFDDRQRMVQEVKGEQSQPEAGTPGESLAEAPEVEGMTAAEAPGDGPGERLADEATPQRMKQAEPELPGQSEQRASAEAPGERGKMADGMTPEAAPDAAPEQRVRQMGDQGVAQPSDQESGLAGGIIDAYDGLAGIVGMQALRRSMSAAGPWAARGAVLQLQLARHLMEPLTAQEAAGRVEDTVAGRAGADIVLEDDRVVEAKNYYWAGPFFQHEDNVLEATRRLVRQVELLRRRYEDREVELAFSDREGMPQQMAILLQSVGIRLASLDIVALQLSETAGEPLVNRLQQMTVQSYGRALVKAGWTDRSAATAARLRMAFERDAASAYLGLAVYAFDGESIYETNRAGESYTAHLERLQRYSDGALQLENIMEEVRGEWLLIGFESGGQHYEARVDAGHDYFSHEVLEMINTALGAQGEPRRFIPLPSPDQVIYLAFVAPGVLERLQSAGLIPPLDAGALTS